MPELELSQNAQHWVNVVLVWIGFGTLAGLLALVILPVRRPAGPIAAVFLGIVGSMVGLLVFSLVVGGQDFNPISPLGFLMAVAGAFGLLILYRVLCLCVVKSDEDTG